MDDGSGTATEKTVMLTPMNSPEPVMLTAWNMSVSPGITDMLLIAPAPPEPLSKRKGLARSNASPLEITPLVSIVLFFQSDQVLPRPISRPIQVSPEIETCPV